MILKKIVANQINEIKVQKTTYIRRNMISLQEDHTKGEMKHVFHVKWNTLSIRLQRGLLTLYFISELLCFHAVIAVQNYFLKIKNFLHQIIWFARPHIFLNYSHKISTACEQCKH